MLALGIEAPVCAQNLRGIFPHPLVLFRSKSELVGPSYHEKTEKITNVRLLKNFVVHVFWFLEGFLVRKSVQELEEDYIFVVSNFGSKWPAGFRVMTKKLFNLTKHLVTHQITLNKTFGDPPNHF